MGGCPSPSGKRGPVPPPRPKSRRNRLPETRHPQSHGLDDLHITIKQPNIKPSNIVQLHQIKDGFQMFSIHQRIHLNWFILPKTRFFSHNPSTCSIFHLFVKEKGISCDFLNNFQGTQFWEPRYLRRHRLLELWATRPWRGIFPTMSFKCMANYVWQIIPWIYMEYLGDV